MSKMQRRSTLQDIMSPEEGLTAVAGTNRIRLVKAEETRNGRWVDEQRSFVQAQEYLCHIGEAMEWIEEFIDENIDSSNSKEASIVQLENTLHDGVILAKLARRIDPTTISGIISGDTKHTFLRSNNVNAFLTAIKIVGLPNIFWFEFVDVYNRKNMPKVIYCIHALSHLLHSEHNAPKIRNWDGEFTFSNEILVATQKSLKQSGAPMPNFGNLEKELSGKNRPYSFAPIKEPILDNRILTRQPPAKTSSPLELVLADSDDSDSESRISEEDEETKEDLPAQIQRLAFITAAAESTISSSGSELELYERSDRSELESEPEFESEDDEDFIATQGRTRTYMVDSQLRQIKEQSRYQDSTIKNLQARIKTMTQEHRLGEKRLEFFSSPDDWATGLQAVIRRKLAIKDLGNKYQVRAEGRLKAQFRESTYQKLKSEKNPSIGDVKSLLHLLSNDDVDFKEDLVIEDLRQKVIESIRDNNHMDGQVSMLDIQIALLLKNVVTLDEVVKLNNAFLNPNRKKQEQRRFSEMVSPNSSNNAHDLRSVDKANREKLELYQQLVYLLQTEPNHLARLMSVSGGQVHGQKKGQRKVESTVLALFGYGTNAREECLLINLCKACIVQEMKYVQSPQEFMRGNYTFMKLVVQVNRGVKEREFFSTLFKGLFEKVLGDSDLSLVTDPVSIYNRCISEEESRTGRPSTRPYAVNQAQALQSPDVIHILSAHLNRLRDLTNEFLSAIIQTVDAMPYGMRVIARELRLVMEEQFPNVAPEEIIKILGNFIYYRYLSPAITAPEQYVSINHDVSSLQRKNLAEISKMLQQISNGKEFDPRNSQLSLLNDFIRVSNQRFTQWFLDLTDVEEPEAHFGLDQHSDYINTKKPTVYVHPTELYHIHHLLEQDADYLERADSSVLRSILQDLGEAPTDTGMSVPLHILRLDLTDRRDGAPSKFDGDVKKLLLDTKRLVVLVIQVQSGGSLEDIFNQPSTEEHEKIWEQVREEQFPSEGTEKEIEMAIRERNFKFGYENAAMDVKSLTFVQLKSFASKLHSFLLDQGVIPPSPGYQSVINMIAVDITKKGERRRLRFGEIKKLQTILQNLHEKHEFLIAQGTSYKGYLDGCMANMAKKKAKKQKFAFPFTKQYFHMRHLQKLGVVPTFGSFKYSAKTLYERGILLDVENVSTFLYSKITIIISMDKPGVVSFECYIPGMGTKALRDDVLYEELLQTQFEGVQKMKVSDGNATVNVNLLIYLINKKFYHTSSKK